MASMNDVPVEHHGKALHIENDQRAEATLERDGVRRQKADAHAGDHRLLDRLRALQFHRDTDFGKPAAETLGHRSARVRPPFTDQERLAQDHVHRNSPLARERMAGRGDDHIRMR